MWLKLKLRGRGIPLHLLDRHVSPQRLWFLHRFSDRFGLKTGINFAYFNLV